MTVAELRRTLAAFPDDIPVVVEGYPEEVNHAAHVYADTMREAGGCFVARFDEDDGAPTQVVRIDTRPKQ